MKSFLIDTLKATDRILSRGYLKLAGEKKHLLCFLFHGIFRDRQERSLHLLDAEHGITIDQFRVFVEYMLDCQYTFVSPDDILQGLQSEKKYVMITFDDGYFSNQFVLPVLREFHVPAVFFISTYHIINQRCFWWDVLYRNRIGQDVCPQDRYAEIIRLKRLTNDEIEQNLIREFGSDAFKPVSDIDRPFTLAELKNFSREKYVHLGNHTRDHAILTNYSPEAIAEQIAAAQNDLRELTGITPKIISYPNGSYNDKIIEISRQADIALGITVDPKKNRLPVTLRDNQALLLGRYALQGDDDIVNQCDIYRAGIRLYDRIRTFWEARHEFIPIGYENTWQGPM